ncbi:hypothetical protein ACWD3J_22950 [Streptomyces sp. NPDC002755]
MDPHVDLWHSEEFLIVSDEDLSEERPGEEATPLKIIVAAVEVAK